MKLEILFMNDVKYKTPIRDVYELWFSVWKEAYVNDFQIKENLNSDYFLSQDIWICLNNGEKYFAIISLKFFDLKYEMDLKNSYFNVWPSDTIYQITQLGNKYFSCGNLSVIPEYRGIKILNEFSVKDILFGVVRELFLKMKVDGVISNTRNARSVNLSAYRTGAFALKKNIEFTIKGQSVDLLMWHKDYLGAYESVGLEQLVINLMKRNYMKTEELLGGNNVRNFI